MKKITINFAMALLWPLLQSYILTLSIPPLLILILAANSVSAQETVPLAITIGQKIPDVLWKAPMVSVSPSREETIFLGDFKGKAVIIDFWASWCEPCLRNMPTLDSLHLDKKADLQVIMMNASSSRDGYVKERKFIREYLQLHPNFITPIVLRNDLFRQYFLYNIVPHYVWIGADGIVKAITDHTVLTSGNISKLITAAEMDLTVKAK